MLMLFLHSIPMGESYLTEQRPGCRQHLEIQRCAPIFWLTELPTLVIFLFFTIHEFL